MANTCVEKRMKNINIDGVENCNLLCKLIIDYVPSNKCIVKKTENIETFGSAPFAHPPKSNIYEYFADEENDSISNLNLGQFNSEEIKNFFKLLPESFKITNSIILGNLLKSLNNIAAADSAELNNLLTSLITITLNDLKNLLTSLSTITTDNLNTLLTSLSTITNSTNLNNLLTSLSTITSVANLNKLLTSLSTIKPSTIKPDDNLNTLLTALSTITPGPAAPVDKLNKLLTALSNITPVANLDKLLTHLIKTEIIDIKKITKIKKDPPNYDDINILLNDNLYDISSFEEAFIKENYEYIKLFTKKYVLDIFNKFKLTENSYKKLTGEQINHIISNNKNEPLLNKLLYSLNELQIKDMNYESINKESITANQALLFYNKLNNIEENESTCTGIDSDFNNPITCPISYLKYQYPTHEGDYKNEFTALKAKKNLELYKKLYDDNYTDNVRKIEEKITCEYISNRTYIDYPAGSFINYRDTSYEATRVFFFAPSRHSIDNEQFDFEVNIYHGTFIEGVNREGIEELVWVNILNTFKESELIKDEYRIEFLEIFI